MAQSKPLEMCSSYWIDHKDKMKENDSLFKVYLSLITTKTGEIINNSIVKEIIDNLILNSNLDLSFVGGSPIGYLKNNREDGESYKGTKTLFSSIIVLTYLLRY